MAQITTATIASKGAQGVTRVFVRVPSRYAVISYAVMKMSVGLNRKALIPGNSQYINSQQTAMNSISQAWS